jgi:hypothetical protein
MPPLSPLSLPGGSMLAGRAMRGAGRVRAPATLAQFLDQLRRAEQAQELDRFFGRIPEVEGSLRSLELPLSEAEQFAQADPGIFGPAAQRMMNEGAFNRSVEPAEMDPLADQLAALNRRRALEKINIGRLPEDDPRRAFAGIANAAEEGLKAQRQAEAMAQAARAEEVADFTNAATSYGPLMTGAGASSAAMLAAALGPSLMPSADDAPADAISMDDYLSPEVAMDEQDEEAIVREILDAVGSMSDLPDEDEPEIALESDPFSDAMLSQGMGDPGLRVRAGAARIPGLSPEAQQAMDSLVLSGMDPMEALQLIRGQLKAGVR